MCVLCCDGGTCRTANETNQCNGVESCKQYNDDVCGIQFSDSEQAFYCGIDDPIVFPPTLDIPNEFERAGRWKPDVVFFTTAENPEVETAMQQRLIRSITFPPDTETEIEIVRGDWFQLKVVVGV